ncbi:MsnO8 family LLM class oxidoreductase [Phenylobacterium sp.]|jgi:luciferase family oxidoreductase group 1|uniref:MsnO8 family LLM class oxidoreductase n=1 Tax=Phenylobacterium sp. TaxID=1871053 RepID=UPI002E2EB2E1|nr:MsnO8 family LLM class oxidoreductase [Phenylobacterium sp.]HEX2560153.1 MsnO8 family LLM class oxidoreductase [Phenylobacterium sp.]
MALLSVLDLSPVTGDATQAQAVRESIEVAKAAERLGYHRFWVAEHHNIGGLGSPAPEILIAALTQATSRIRLGSGGVMLVNYSPLKVAEVFMELEALAPGRIDLGVGRALGTDPRTGGALRSSGSEAFEHYFALLASWLLDASGKVPIGPEHPAHEIRANPSGPSHPQLFMLCSSAESAAWAGASGVGMVFAEFIARAEGGPAVAAYRASFRPGPFLEQPWAGVATAALAADTAEDARRLDAPRRASQLATSLGQRQRFRTVEAAETFLAEHAGSPALAGIEPAAWRAIRPSSGPGWRRRRRRPAPTRSSSWPPAPASRLGSARWS